MDIQTAVIILLASAFPILILIPMQIFLVLKSRRNSKKLIPIAFSLLLLVSSQVFLTGNGIQQIIAALYCILLLILCGTGWVIASAIRKSRRP